MPGVRVEAKLVAYVLVALGSFQKIRETERLVLNRS
jgi:hypothetical protein